MLLLQTCSLSFPLWGTSSTVVALASPPSGVTEGGALRLACCSPSAASQAHYTWFKSTSTSTSLSPSYNGQVWNISQVTSDNSGTFYCQMHTGDQVQKSASLSLDVECRLSIIFIKLKHLFFKLFHFSYQVVHVIIPFAQTPLETHFYWPPKSSLWLWPAAVMLTHQSKHTPGMRVQHVSPQQTGAFTQWGIHPLWPVDQEGHTLQPASSL